MFHTIFSLVFLQELSSYTCIMLYLAFGGVGFCNRLCVGISQEILPCTEQNKDASDGEIPAQTAKPRKLRTCCHRLTSDPSLLKFCTYSGSWSISKFPPITRSFLFTFTRHCSLVWVQVKLIKQKMTKHLPRNQRQIKIVKISEDLTVPLSFRLRMYFLHIWNVKVELIHLEDALILWMS